MNSNKPAAGNVSPTLELDRNLDPIQDARDAEVAQEPKQIVVSAAKKIVNPSPYRRLDFKSLMELNLDDIRQRSVSPCEQIPYLSKAEEKLADENTRENLVFTGKSEGVGIISTEGDTHAGEVAVPRFVDEGVTLEGDNQDDLLRASSRNPTATLELGLDGKITYLSRSWETFVGTKARKIVGKPISEIIVGMPEDTEVFQRAVEIMTQDDSSYKVRFVVRKRKIRAENDDEMQDDEDDDRSASTVEDDFPAMGQRPESWHKPNSPITQRSHSPTLSSGPSNESSSPGASDESSFIELECQGVIIHDVKTGQPSHSMWIIRPYVEHFLEIELPSGLADILGFGSELFVNYLNKVSDSGIVDMELVIPPDQLFCNICEQQVPSWWLERHSEICYFESSSDSDLQITHDDLVEHKNLIVSIINSKTSTYKSYALPISLDNQYKSSMQKSSKLQALRFPYKTLYYLSDLCDQSILIDPEDFESDEEKELSLSQEIEKQFDEILEWKIPKSNDNGINLLVADTEHLVRQKADSALRVVNTRKFHNQLKKEVDILVLQALQLTIERNKGGFLKDNESVMNSPDLIYSYMDTDNFNTVTGTRSQSKTPVERHSSANSIVSNKRNYLMESSQLIDQLSLLDPIKNESSSSLRKIQQPVSSGSSLNVQESPKRAYSPVPTGSPLSSIHKNNKSLTNLFLNGNDSGIFKNNTASSSPVLVGGEVLSNVFLKDDSLGVPGQARPPLSPLMISSFVSPKPSAPSIKDYEIIKPISKGAFGSVYLSRKKVTGEYFAIKVLKKSDMVAKNQVTNVKAERAIMMSQSDSPFVAKLFSTFQTRNYLFLVMEYLSGGDCASLLKVLGNLSINWTKRYVAEMVVTVDDLHKKGIVHRDLKPDNFLIDSRGHLKLTDFGLSRMGLVGRQVRHKSSGNIDTEASTLLNSIGKKNSSPIIPLINDHKRTISHASSISSEGSSPTSIWFDNLLKYDKSISNTPTRLTYDSSPLVKHDSPKTHGSPIVKPLRQSDSQTSFAMLDEEDSNPSSALVSIEARKFVGTPDYLAPETIKGKGQHQSSDWWSLGCIMFEFLFGYPPFHADNVNQVFENITEGVMDWPQIPAEELEQICSPDARDLIEKLLQVDMNKRLGNNGAEEIKKHPYFKSINWDLLFDEEASFIPNVEDPESTDYFDSRGAKLNHEITKHEESAIFGSNEQLPFEENISYLGVDSWLDNNGVEGSEMGLHSPSSLKKERRKSTRLNNDNSSEFGSFNYRNLTALEKANKDVINRLKSEHLDHQKNSLSSSSLSIESGTTRSRGISFSSGYNTSPIHKPTSNSPNKNALNVLVGHSHSFSATTSSPLLKHERLNSSGEDCMSISGRNSPINKDSFKSLPAQPVLKLIHKGIGDKGFGDISGSSSDNEELKNNAISRLERRSFRRLNPVARKVSTTSMEKSEHAKFKNLNVLLYEPIPIFRYSSKKLFETLGCSVVAVGNGDEIIRRVSGQVKFDIIFTTVKAQRLDMNDIVKLIRYTNTINSNTPIVALTSFYKEAVGLKIFDDVVEKPATAYKLGQILAKYCDEEEACEAG